MLIYTVLDLGRETFTKLRFRLRSKSLGAPAIRPGMSSRSLC